MTNAITIAAQETAIPALAAAFIDGFLVFSLVAPDINAISLYSVPYKRVSEMPFSRKKNLSTWEGVRVCKEVVSSKLL